MDERELDALVATEVMGDVLGPAVFFGNWKPSTNIADAMRVVEKMRQTHSVFSLFVSNDVGWIASFDDFQRRHDGSADAPAMAICKAALSAKGVSTEQPDAIPGEAGK